MKGQDTKKAPFKESAFVPEAGVEPARYCYHWILNPARLPIPPLGHFFKKRTVKVGICFTPTNESKKIIAIQGNFSIFVAHLLKHEISSKNICRKRKPRDGRKNR